MSVRLECLLALVLAVVGVLLTYFPYNTLIDVVGAGVSIVLIVVSAFIVWFRLWGLGVGRVGVTPVFREVFAPLPRYFVAVLSILAVYAALYFASLPLLAPYYHAWLEATRVAKPLKPIINVATVMFFLLSPFNAYEPVYFYMDVVAYFLVSVVSFTLIFMLIVWMFDVTAQASMGVTASVRLASRRFVVYAPLLAIATTYMVGVLYWFVLYGAPGIGTSIYAEYLMVTGIVLTFITFENAVHKVVRVLGSGATAAVAVQFMVVFVVMLLAEVVRHAEIHLLITYIPLNLLPHLIGLLLSLLTALPLTVWFVRNVLTKQPR